MIRGTTPTLLFALPFETTIIKTVWITFSQHNEELFTIDNDGCELGDNSIKILLSQKQTLQLDPNTTVKIQIRVLTNDDVAMASNTLTVPVVQILKDGEING